MRNRPLRSNRPGPQRRGLTLYEVVLSMAIFFMAMAGVSQLISIGSDSAVAAKLTTEAAMHCESRMNEVIAGAIPLEDVSDQPLEEGNDAWQWTLVAKKDEPVPGMVDLTVTVSHYNTDGVRNATFSLRRLIRDPQVFIDAAEEAEAKAAAAAEEAAGLDQTTGN